MNGLEKVEIDYGDCCLPHTFRTIKPDVFKDGDSYCCIFGPDPQEGIFGCGDTPDQAILDWHQHLQERIHEKHIPDEVAHQARLILNPNPCNG